jgi:PAS domain S-box-containing protein
MDTILLLMEKTQDRRLLEEHLQGKYALAASAPDVALRANFDLCIADGVALSRYRDQLAARKAINKDVYLPVLLVTTRRKVSLLTGNIWQVIDEVITTPIQKAELHARVEVLLRARRLSLELLTQKNLQLQQTQHLLQETKALHDAIIACSPLAIYGLSPDGRVISWNPAAEEMLGWRDDEVLGRRLPFVQQDKIEEFHDLMQRLLRGETLNGAHVVRQRRDGSLFDGQLFAAPIRDAANKIIGVVGVLEDITEQKRAERALQHSHELMRYIIEHVRSAVAVHDRDLRYIYVSQRYLREFGVQETNIIGKHHYEVFPDLPQKWRDVHRRALAGEVLSAEDDIYEHADGSVDWTRWECRPWYEADGSIGGVIVYTEVITERKKLEEQLRQSQKLESIGQLAGGVAHDFNNMLAVILIQTEMALMGIGPEHPLYNRFEEIRKAAQRSASLTQQLLAFARKQPINPRVLNLNEIVTEVLKMLRRLIGEDIELVWTPAADLWQVKLDPVQIDQVLANLCVNARDSIAGAGKIVIEVRNVTIDADYCARRPEAQPGQFVLLSVSDTGTGIAPENLPRVFEPFFTTKEVGQGTGLGLATVYGIVKQNGGFINVYSELGHGTTFNIYLPRYTDAPAEAFARRDDAPGYGQGETILLVEDESAVLDVIQSMLEQLGYCVLVANAPRQAIELVEKHSPHIDLVITDVIMPDMNGHELVERLRILVPQIRAIFMSGYPTSVIAHRNVLRQEVNYIQKPFTVTELAAKIRSVLET